MTHHFCQMKKKIHLLYLTVFKTLLFLVALKIKAVKPNLP